ncbi:uncharacterized protein LOC115215596 [Octopus sinensis]|uniref:Uncharacterized protein LOC115215596 n=1 Tax=Octopus sinensis TaxID=2607531 RepID=A0A6P7SQU8_9MOLL|nr:uncharacterized protein LOC115215596 [Octopus sinensis]
MASIRKQFLLVFLTVLFPGNTQSSTSDHIEFVDIQQISSELDTSDNGMTSELPNQLAVQFQAHGHNVQLKLMRKQDITLDIPFCIFENNETVCNMDTNIEKAYDIYQDPEKMAAVTVELIAQNKTQTPVLKLNGEFIIGDELFEIESDNTEWLESPNKNFHYVKRRSILRAVNNGKVLKSNIPEDLKDRYGVELLVIVGHSIYEKFLQQSNNNFTESVKRIRYYFSHIVNSIDFRYANIGLRDFEVYVRLSGYLLIKNASSTPFITNSLKRVNNSYKLNGTTALDGLKQFLESQKDYPSYDHAMMFTDYDAFHPRKRILGTTYASGICTTKHVSLVVDHGAYTSGGTAAHELAHNLGVVDHDGEGKAKNCPPERHHIMSPSIGILSNTTKGYGFKFSDCSVEQLRVSLKDLDESGMNCLNNEAFINNSTDFSGSMETLPGEVHNVHDQCRQIYGPDSFMCPPAYPSQICYKMMCYVPATSKCVTESGLRAAIGTPCGYQKGCYFGNCLVNISQQLVADDCPYPDLPYLVNCKLASPLLCNNTEFYKRCCTSCNKDFTKEDLCKDVPVRILSKFNCSQFLLHHGLIQCTKKLKPVCCRSCEELQNDPEREPAPTGSCKDDEYVEINNLRCSKFVVMYGKKACARDDIREACCASCRRADLLTGGTNSKTAKGVVE